MSQIAFTKKDLKKHVPVWGIITIFLCIDDPVEGSLVAQITGTLLIMFTYIFTYYVVALYIMPRYWAKNYLLLSVFIFALLCFSQAVDYLNFYYVIPDLGGLNPFRKHPDVWFFISPSFLFAVNVGIAITFYFNKLSIKRLKAQNDREKLLIVKELNFVKNQFNSHITFNFLNYCYSHIHKVSEEAADAIEIFSDILRYSLQLKPDEKIPIQKEIEYIYNFINLQKCLSSKVYVEFKVIGGSEGKCILPRILINFVENAFKHGQINDQNSPLLISLEMVDAQINFVVKNKKNHSKNVISTGIGAENVRKVLDLYYRGKYKLRVIEDNIFFSSELILKVA